MAEARITHIDTEDSTDVICVFSNVGPSGIT